MFKIVLSIFFSLSKFFSMEQCSSPTTAHSQKRCQNTAILGSKHCYLHNPSAVALYKKYKNICERLSIYDHSAILQEKNSQRLLKYYNLIHRAYIGRLKHRSVAFVEECYDKGHNYQLEKLQKMLSEVESCLEKIWIEERVANIVQEENNTSEHIDNASLERIGNTSSGYIDGTSPEYINNTSSSEEETQSLDLVKRQTERKELEKEINELFQQYKWKIDKEKVLLEEKLFACIDKKTPTFNEFKKISDKDSSVDLNISNLGLGNLAICITNIVIKLDELGCLSDNYVPDERVSVNTTSSCVRPYHRGQGEYGRYCEMYPIYTIKRVYEVILLKWKVIEPILKALWTFSFCYNTYEVFRWLYKIIWNGQYLTLKLFRKTAA